MPGAPRVIVFAIFPDVTQLDFTGPLQVLARLPQTEIVLASAGGGRVKSDVGLVFADIRPLAAVQRCDVLFVPGGFGQIAAMEDDDYMNEIRRLGAKSQFITSVCTGSLILAAAGFLHGKHAACHWASRHFLAELGAIPDDGRVVQDGNVLTGGGVTAGIDFALSLAALLAGRETAEAIQLGLEYAPQPPFDAGRPETAPAGVRRAVQDRLAPMTERRRQAVAAAARKMRNAGA